MWDNFLGAQTRGEMCGCICPSRLGRRIKKQQLTRRGGRQAARGEEREGRTGGGGNICEATTLWKGSAACPPVCKAASCTTHTHTHKQMCTYIWVVMQRCRHINRQTRAHQDRFTKCNNGLIDHVWKFVFGLHDGMNLFGRFVFWMIEQAASSSF